MRSREGQVSWKAHLVAGERLAPVPRLAGPTVDDALLAVMFSSEEDDDDSA